MSGVPILVIMGISLIACGVLRTMDGNWRAGFILVGLGALALLLAAITRRKQPRAYGIDSMDLAMGNRSPIQGANVGHIKPMQWSYDPQQILTVESWAVGPYFISKHNGKFHVVKNYTLLGIEDRLEDAQAIAEKDRRES